MLNLAGHPEASEHCVAELTVAGIEVVTVAAYGEPQSTIAGKLGEFEFRRAWYYWTVRGRVPLDVARRLFLDPIGVRDVRVAGHCGCPSPEPSWISWLNADDREVVIDPSGSEEAEYDRFVERGSIDAWQKPLFAKTIDGLRGYVTSYHVDSQEGLKLFADAVRGLP